MKDRLDILAFAPPFFLGVFALTAQIFAGRAMRAAAKSGDYLTVLLLRRVIAGLQFVGGCTVAAISGLAGYDTVTVVILAALSIPIVRVINPDLFFSVDKYISLVRSQSRDRGKSDVDGQI